MASIMLGMDFNETEAYIAIWAEDERCPKNFLVPEKSDGDHIPLFVVPCEDGTFKSGHEGVQYSINEKCNGSSVLYGDNVKNTTLINGKRYSTTELLTGFIGDVLGSIKKHFGGAQVSRICLTGERMTKDDENRFRDALSNLGYTSENAFIINHANAFLQYMICGRDNAEFKKLRTTVIDMCMTGNVFYYYTPADNKNGCPAYVDHEEIETAEESLRDTTEELEKITNTAISKNRPVNLLYVTGITSDGDNVKNVLRKYASSTMKIFFGRNLYSFGACYKALNEAMTEKVIHDMETCHSISIESYHDATMDAVMLLEAGCPIEKAETTINVIPDDTNELVFFVKDVRHATQITCSMTLEGLRMDERKTVRLEIKVKFLDKQTVVIKVRDMGFGELFPPTYRVWEQILSL